MKTKIWKYFQICISVPLRNKTNYNLFAYSRRYFKSETNVLFELPWRKERDIRGKGTELRLRLKLPTHCPYSLTMLPYFPEIHKGLSTNLK